MEIRTAPQLPSRDVRRANMAVAKKVHKKLLKGQTTEHIAKNTGIDLEFVLRVKDHFNL